MIKSLLVIGLPRAFVMIIVKMYLAVRVVVRVGRRILRVVQRRIGVKQGCNLYLRLFSLYINDT